MKSFELPDDIVKRFERETAERWREWAREVPFIALDPGWTISVIPPFAGAAARFRVRDQHGSEVSVYLDSCDALGCYGKVYWEVYPDGEGENGRCDMEDGTALLKMIREGLAKQRQVAAPETKRFHYPEQPS